MNSEHVVVYDLHSACVDEKVVVGSVYGHVRLPIIKKA